jgi:uncharacterized membrane protein YuzA (DUF378 family)
MNLNSGLSKFLFILAIVGAINWGLIGVFNFNLVAAIFGGGVHEVSSALSRVIYTLVGVCGILALYLLFKGARPGPRTA